MGASPKMWTGLILLSLALLSRVDGESNEIAPDGTISVEPLSVVPPPPKSSSDSADVAPPSPPQPGPGKGPGPGPGPGASSGPGSGPGGPHDLSGTSTETKNPDGSTITVTHFRGNLPQSSFHNFGFPAWNHVPSPYFYPWGPHPGQGLPLPFNPNGNFRSQQPFQPNNGGSGPPLPPGPVPAPEKNSS